MLSSVIVTSYLYCEIMVRHDVVMHYYLGHIEYLKDYQDLLHMKTGLTCLLTSVINHFHRVVFGKTRFSD